MRRRAIRYLSLVLIIISLLLATIPVQAEYDKEVQQRASAYITSVYANTTVSNGTVNVYFAITGTGPMDSLGATEILIFNTHNACVAYLDDTNTSGLMGYNQGYYSNTIGWPYAVSGEHYYAIVFYKSEKDGGYDTTSYMTGWAP